MDGAPKRNPRLVSKFLKELRFEYVENHSMASVCLILYKNANRRASRDIESDCTHLVMVRRNLTSDEAGMVK